MEWPVFKGENQIGTKHEKMLNITSCGSNENKNYIKIRSHPSQKGDNKYWRETKGVLTQGGQWTDPLLPVDSQWTNTSLFADGLQTDSSSHNGNGQRDSPPPKCIQYMAHSLCSPKTPHQHVTDTSNTSVNSQQLSNKPTQASNSRGMNKKTWPVHNGTFQPQRTTKSGSLWYNVCDWRWSC